jgi:serine/threonine protein kinase
LVHDDGRILLADFGVTATLDRVSGGSDAGDVSGSNADSASMWARYASRSTFVGTPAYIAPEVMEQSEGYALNPRVWPDGMGWDTSKELEKP